MARGHDAHQERLAEINRLGKPLSKAAGFACELCEGKDALRPHDTAPDKAPTLEALLFLCAPCRRLVDGEKAPPARLRGFVNVLWSERPIVRRTAAALLTATGEPWALEAVENASFEDYDDD